MTTAGSTPQSLGTTRPICPHCAGMTDHAVELCEGLMNNAEHRSMATRHLRTLARRMWRIGEPERITIAERIDEIIAV